MRWPRRRSEVCRRSRCPPPSSWHDIESHAVRGCHRGERRLISRPALGSSARRFARRTGTAPAEMCCRRRIRQAGGAMPPPGEAERDGERARYRRAIRDYMAQNNLAPPQRIIAELQASRILRAVYSERQLQEVMVDFWTNHFNVFAGKGADRWLLTSYDRDTIRPHALGKFRHLLGSNGRAVDVFSWTFSSVSRTRGAWRMTRQRRRACWRCALEPHDGLRALALQSGCVATPGREDAARHRNNSTPAARHMKHARELMDRIVGVGLLHAKDGRRSPRLYVWTISIRAASSRAERAPPTSLRGCTIMRNVVLDKKFRPSGMKDGKVSISARLLRRPASSRQMCRRSHRHPPPSSARRPPSQSAVICARPYLDFAALIPAPEIYARRSKRLSN